jgi:hypothetical protein
MLPAMPLRRITILSQSPVFNPSIVIGRNAIVRWRKIEFQLVVSVSYKFVHHTRPASRPAAGGRFSQLQGSQIAPRAKAMNE